MLQNRIYRGEIVHNRQSYIGEHEPIIDQPLWDAVQAQLAGNAAQRNQGGKTRQPSLLAGMLFDRDGNRMTPSHAVKKSTRYRYYVSGSLITKDRTENAAGLRIPAAEIEQLVSDRVQRWLPDPGTGTTMTCHSPPVMVAIGLLGNEAEGKGQSPPEFHLDAQRRWEDPSGESPVSANRPSKCAHIPKTAPQDSDHPVLWPVTLSASTPQRE